MAGPQFDVDPDVLKAQARSFDRMASEFASKSKQFEERMQALEKGWGEDDVKLVSALLDVYGPVSGGILGALEHLGEALKGVGEKLDSTARSYEQTEEDHLHALKQAAQQRHG
ncbi:WXG100 family type VII secretion target [Streptomyces endophyticus]|uniref:WXG100 family type VII secretion target n=1 Tax=Streptomyces endophyticus TaxID=714166 RepID=A0ABU6FIN8_9ACTN|nr:hypothetical protein [Streptomyces endophyticus]MEB8342657.1 hypothetical protein [Streptomyces endophyticus]